MHVIAVRAPLGHVRQLVAEHNDMGHLEPDRPAVVLAVEQLTILQLLSKLVDVVQDVHISAAG